MANLFLRRGPLTRLSAAPLVDGAISFTTDEPGIYLDILEGSEVVRKRVGDLIQVQNIKALVANVNEETGAMTGIATSAQGLVSEWSESALYYAIDDNALLKYIKPAAGQTVGSWVQVNTVGDLPAKIKAASERIDALEGTVGNATKGLVKDVADLQTTVGDADGGLVKDVATQATDIANLKKAVGMGEDGEVEGIGATVAQLSEDLDALELEVHGTDGNGGIKSTLADHTGKITALEQASAQHVTKEEAKAFAKTADIQSTLEKVDTTTGVTAAIKAAVDAEKDRAVGVEDTIKQTVASVKATADSAVQTATFTQFKTENTTAIGTAKTEAIADATDAAKTYTDSQITAEVTRANGAYAPKSLVDTVAGHTGTLSTLTSEDPTTAGSVAQAKKAAEDAMAEAQKKTTMAEVEAKDYATKTEAQGYANAKDTAIKAAADAAAAAQSTIDTWVGDHSNDYTNAQIDEKVADAKKAGTDAQTALNTYKTDHASDYTNKQIDDKITVASGSASAAQGAADAAQRDATQALADAAAAQKDIDDYIKDHTNDYTNTQIDTAVADAKKAGTDAAAIAESNSGKIATLQGKVDTLNGDAQTKDSVDYKIAQAKTELEGTITSEINAANAMTYKGGVGSSTDLTNIESRPVSVGDTYVVTGAFNGYYPGDMLVAADADNTENANGIIEGTISWTHVKTGYDATLEQTLSGKDNKITLSSVSSDNKGEITFAVPVDAQGKATTSASVSVANNTVTIGMVWGEF